MSWHFMMALSWQCSSVTCPERLCHIMAWSQLYRSTCHLSLIMMMKLLRSCSGGPLGEAARTGLQWWTRAGDGRYQQHQRGHHLVSEWSRPLNRLLWNRDSLRYLSSYQNQFLIKIRRFFFWNFNFSQLLASASQPWDACTSLSKSMASLK